jgi:hypothetical protein
MCAVQERVRVHAGAASCSFLRWDPPVVEVDHPLGKGRQCVIGAHSTSSRSAGCIREGDVYRASHLCAKTTQGTQPRHVLALWAGRPCGAATRVATFLPNAEETHYICLCVSNPRQSFRCTACQLTTSADSSVSSTRLTLRPSNTNSRLSAVGKYCELPLKPGWTCFSETGCTHTHEVLQAQQTHAGPAHVSEPSLPRT